MSMPTIFAGLGPVGYVFAIFHLIGALSEFGKLGLTAIGADRDRAEALYRQTVAVLDREAAA